MVRPPRWGDLEFGVTEEFIAEAIELPTTGQRWTKGHPVDKELCAQLLKPQYRNTKWSDGNVAGLAGATVGSSV
jgi:hypothetical protein